MSSLRQALFSRFKPRFAARLIADLPPYQVALWPDGWVLDGDGSVTVRDTHAMAEARRWYRLAERNRSVEAARRVMSLHGVFVPRAIVEMAQQCFPSEPVASVAVQLVAGEWVQQRRRYLLEGAEDAVRARNLAWSGSRHQPGLDEDAIGNILRGLLNLCVTEGLIPNASYRLQVFPDDGYGIPAYRCRVQVCLESYARGQVAGALRAALIPWNRAVVRDGTPAPLIALQVHPRQSAPRY